MGITIDKTFEEILDRLIATEQFVRISFGKEENSIGKIIFKDRDKIYLSPYAVWEPVFGFQRARLERIHYKPILKTNIIPEPISEDYIMDLIISSNYLNSRKIQHKKLRERLFNPEIYSMPDKELAEIFERELRYNEGKKEFEKPNILIVSSMHEVKKFLNGKY